MTVEMYGQSCCKCGVVFMITNSFDDRLRKSHETFYCPNGHAQSYAPNGHVRFYAGETDANKLKRLELYLKNANSRLFEARRSNSALRGVITKMKGKK